MAELVEAATKVGVERILEVGIDEDSSRAALAAAETYPLLRAAVGRHPNGAGGIDIGLLRELAAHPACVAIGETGLDYYRDRAPRTDQRRAFEAQLELARECGKPVLIHTRDAADDTLAMLREHAGNLRVVLHCFSLTDHAEECIAAGWWLSFAGNVTYPKSELIQRAAASVPAQRLLVETDAPYLAPQSRRGKPNEPAAVVETAQFIAELRGVSYAQLEQEVRDSAQELFEW